MRQPPAREGRAVAAGADPPPGAVTPIADADIREYIAVAGRKVAGRPVSGPIATADKLLLIARDDKGFPVTALNGATITP